MLIPNTNTVLLVDDDPGQLVVFGRHLRLNGFNVLTACNGVEAFRLFGDQNPPMVITDWEMPDMDGLSLCRSLRSMESTSFTYIIMLTAHSEIDYIVTAFEAGANDYVSKPCNPRELLARVQAGQRIVCMEATNQQQSLVSRRMNAELGATNASLQRMARQLDQARKDAEAAGRAKSEFLANMSHEIRTPMTAILGFADNLLDTTLSSTDRHHAIYTIRRNGEFLLEIINDILDFSKIEAGRLDVERIRSSPIQLVADVQALLMDRAREKGLTFEVEYEGSIPESIEVDPTRLRQILINLVGNAIKFTQDGSIRLICRFIFDEDDPQMQFDVIDTGVGMTEEQMNRLFQPFVQADTSTTRRFGGTGLGLAISRRLAEMLGGNITIVHTHPGVGTQFRATISTGSLSNVRMLTNPKAEFSVHEKTEDPADSEIKLDCRVLLAEDGPDNQRLIQHILKKAGGDIVVVENGRKAVDEALKAHDQGHTFDVILMDMQMPIMDGYEACALLRTKGYDGFIIALTAHAMTGAREKCIKAGCNDYLTKPIDRRKLVRMISTRLHPTTSLS